MKIKNTPQKLSAKDLDDLLERARLWVGQEKLLVGKLIRHMAWQEKENESLRAEVREFRELQFFEKKKQLENSFPATPPLSKPKFTPVPRGQRIYEMFHMKQSAIETYLKIHPELTLDDLKKEANTWALSNGKSSV